MRGGLAAGKTTLSKGIALGLGIDEEITSPTFTLVYEYDGRLKLYHIDAYRLSSSEDFFDIGAEDMMYGKGVCIIEWSEKVLDMLPKDTIIINIETISPESRKISVENFENEKALL